MEKSFNPSSTWATLEVPASDQLDTLKKIHSAFEALTLQGAALGTAVYETTPHAGGPATYYFAPANGVLAKTFQAQPARSGPGTDRRVYVCGDNQFAASLFSSSGGTDSGG